MSSKDATQKKKVKGKVVPSRYMQSAENYSSDGTSSGSTKTQTILRKNETRIEKNVKTLHSKFSTPQSHAIFPTFDASAISGPSSIFNTQRKDKLKQSSLSKTMVKKSETLTASTCHKKKERAFNQIAKNQNNKNLDDEIDILYSQYLLAVLMENKAKESLVARSCYALEKFEEAYQYVGILLERQENIEKELNLVSYLLKVHKHLQKQEKILSPILDLIPTIEAQYEEIAVAADSVRHKLHTKDIDLPVDGYQDEIMQLMERVISLLENILQITNNTEEIISTAEAAKCFVNRGKAIAEEIKRASEQLLESREFLLSETSLKFSSLTLEDE